ncbi:MAG: metalloregulator ArsR/SmtB family transcription factor [Phycisphaerales bacterium]|nr:metalloregulator ArsR/SmtB family transcription factor [Phycisphaerales bacterium]
MTERDERALDWLAIIGQLGDFARVRMLRLLEAEELGVGELARIVQLPQSTVSRHLKALHDHGWLVKRNAGTASLYRVLPDALEADQKQLWETTRARLGDLPTLADDESRLREVVASRRIDTRAFFGRVGGDWQELRHELFGSMFGADALLGLLNPDWVVADLGCGTGEAAERLAPLVREVVAIDREPAMLKACRKRLREFENIRVLEGDITGLPLEDESLDAAILMLVLHHAVDPAAVIREVGRVLRPGGCLLVVDMVAHDREGYRYTMGHEHLGFADKDVEGWLPGSAFDSVNYHRIRPNPESKGPGLFSASLWKPAD